jgi:hypothetical protein
VWLVLLMIVSITYSLVRAHLRAALRDGVNSFTVGAGIGHFVMAITLADACDIFANTQNRVVHVEIANLIDFICDGNRLAQEGHQRVIPFCDLNDHRLMPGMLVEVAANDLLIFRPLIERVGRRVHAKKPAARPNEIRKCRPLEFT